MSSQLSNYSTSLEFVELKFVVKSLKVQLDLNLQTAHVLITKCLLYIITNQDYYMT